MRLSLVLPALLSLSSLVVAAPPQKDPKAPLDFVILSDIEPTILHDIRYFTPHNFVGVPIDGYLEPHCIILSDAAYALKKVQKKLRKRGYSLKVYDCFRPQRAVDHFIRWAEVEDDVKNKEEFYPTVNKADVFDLGYVAKKSGHSRGSTLDLTIVKLPPKPQRPYVPGEKLVPCFAPYKERFPDNSIDMGTGYDCFNSLSHAADPRIVGQQRWNRDLLNSTMAEEGFEVYSEEWWHFTYKPELFPDTFFDFPVARKSIRKPDCKRGGL